MEDKKEKLPSTRIQWLITVYSNFLRNPLFIRLY